MKKLVIFDLDGTLVNSILDIAESCNHALHEMGYAPHSLTTYHYLVGNGVSKLIERALPEEARRQRFIEAMRTRFTEYYNEHLLDNTTAYPGIPEVLDELKARGIKLAVASNKYQAATEKIVTSLFPDIEWDAIMGQNDMTPLKPDPSVVFNILQKIPTPKSEVLYVGDSAVDMETAYRACVDSVGVSWGLRGRNELANSRATFIVDDPDEILSCLNGPQF